ncbi:hypothetical protein ACFE04_031294 [Oxalis oulophora]
MTRNGLVAHRGFSFSSTPNLNLVATNSNSKSPELMVVVAARRWKKSRRRVEVEGRQRKDALEPSDFDQSAQNQHDSVIEEIEISVVYGGDCDREQQQPVDEEDESERFEVEDEEFTSGNNV